MAKDKNQILWVAGAIIAVVLLYQYSGLFSTINLQSNPIQFLNKPIEARFTTDLIQPNITTFFDDSPINVTMVLINGTYLFTLENQTREGIFKIVMQAGNETISQVIEVKNPYIETSNDIPATANKRDIIEISIQTFNPQGDALNADSVDVDVYDPDNIKTTLFFEKQTNRFVKEFTFNKNGAYLFKIHARKVGYDTKETGAITNVLQSGGIPFIIWIWIGAAGLFIILFIWRRYRR